MNKEHEDKKKFARLNLHNQLKQMLEAMERVVIAIVDYIDISIEATKSES